MKKQSLLLELECSLLSDCRRRSRTVFALYIDGIVLVDLLGNLNRCRYSIPAILGMFLQEMNKVGCIALTLELGQSIRLPQARHFDRLVVLSDCQVHRLRSKCSMWTRSPMNDKARSPNHYFLLRVRTSFSNFGKKIKSRKRFPEAKIDSSQ